MNHKQNIKQIHEMVDRLIVKYENDQFKGWYFAKIKTIGLQLAKELEVEADKGKNPARLFSYLLNKVSGGN